MRKDNKMIAVLLVALVLFLLACFAAHRQEIDAGVHIGNVSDEGRDE
jgi:hypothetical protein